MNMSFSIDYASPSRVIGWIYDPKSGGVPNDVTINFDSISFSLVDLPFHHRPDVNSALNCDASLALGFDINLPDLFNEFCFKYSIVFYVHGEGNPVPLEPAGNGDFGEKNS